MQEASKWSTMLVESFRYDIETRIGFDDVWKQISEPKKAEIITEWTRTFDAIIGAALRSVASKQNGRKTQNQAGLKSKP